MFFTFLLFLLPAPHVYFQSVSRSSPMLLFKNFNLGKPPLIPVNITNKKPPDLSAAGILVVDSPSNVVLYQKNASEKFLPASTTKVMTALVSLDQYSLEDILTVKTVINESRTMGLVVGEKLTFENLLYGALIHSGNDAAYVLAENYPGGVANFVAAMNKKAADLYLTNTHFANSIGFDDPQNYTTAFDLVKLSRVALTNKTFTKIVGTRSITVSDVDFTRFHELRNVNELLGKVAGVSGVKTGFTQNAGEVLLTEVRKNGKSVLIAILKSQDRFGDTEKIIEWVFENFSWKDIKEIT